MFGATRAGLSRRAFWDTVECSRARSRWPNRAPAAHPLAVASGAPSSGSLPQGEPCDGQEPHADEPGSGVVTGVRDGRQVRRLADAGPHECFPHPTSAGGGQGGGEAEIHAVSYTHLTLPTS